jgi:hypothetical protein
VQQALAYANTEDEDDVITALYNTTNTAGDQNVSKMFSGIKYDEDNKVITSYGEYKLIANIYDTKENVMASSMFSPATTPTIVMSNEISSTGTNADDENKLPYYLKQAQDKGYTNGYVVLRNLNGDNSSALGTGKAIPGIVTQMLATEPKSGTIVTNWIRVDRQDSDGQ